MIVKEVENYIDLYEFKKYVLLSTNFIDNNVSNNPTENALINYSNDLVNNLFNYKKLQEISFTSDRAPFASKFPKPVSGTVAPQPAKSISF